MEWGKKRKERKNNFKMTDKTVFARRRKQNKEKNKIEVAR